MTSLPAARGRAARPSIRSRTARMRHNGGASSSCLLVGGSGECFKYSAVSCQWWGWRFDANNCLVNDLVFEAATVAAAATLIALFCGPCAPFAVAIAMILTVYAGWAM